MKSLSDYILENVLDFDIMQFDSADYINKRTNLINNLSEDEYNIFMDIQIDDEIMDKLDSMLCKAILAPGFSPETFAYDQDIQKLISYAIERNIFNQDEYKYKKIDNQSLYNISLSLIYSWEPAASPNLDYRNKIKFYN